MAVSTSDKIASTSKRAVGLAAGPPVSAQNYTFSVDSFDVLEPRSGSLAGLDKGNDSDYVGFSIQVNNGPSQQLTKFIGNKCHHGVFPIGLAFSNVKLADSDAVVVITTIVNSSQGETATKKYLSAALTKLASAAGSALGKALAGEILTQSVKDEIGAAVGATIGTAAIPVVGSALGALGGFLLGEGWGILFPNCDGPVVASMVVYSGAELRALTAGGKRSVTTTHYAGIDSAHGCGDNSSYTVTYGISESAIAAPPPSPPPPPPPPPTSGHGGGPIGPRPPLRPK